MTEPFARLKLIRSPTSKDEGEKLQRDLELVEQLARHDGHSIIAPTDFIVKSGEVVGYMSIGAIPMIHGNFSTMKLRARDSFNLIHVAEQRVELNGAKAVIFPIALNSPFHPL